jgi:hypothetical protein
MLALQFIQNIKLDLKKEEEEEERRRRHILETQEDLQGPLNC